MYRLDPRIGISRHSLSVKATGWNPRRCNGCAPVSAASHYKRWARTRASCPENSTIGGNTGTNAAEALLLLRTNGWRPHEVHGPRRRSADSRTRSEACVQRGVVKAGERGQIELRDGPREAGIREPAAGTRTGLYAGETRGGNARGPNADGGRAASGALRREA